MFTHVIDWRENRDLQRSMFAADVIDIEMLMDSAMIQTNFEAARKFGVKFILSGSNTATEGMQMPRGWNHSKYDARNVRAIQRRFGTRPIKTHPLYSFWRFGMDRVICGRQWVSFLDYYDYNKERAVEILKGIGYHPYPYKHYESVFTRFYQACILPEKFGVDKRKLHLSTLVISGQMERSEALSTLEDDPYPDPVQKVDDRQFVLKKLGLSEAEFEQYLRRPPVPHSTYTSEIPRARKVGQLLRGARRLFTFEGRSR
ncbi:MAG: hypothetical protein EOP09_20795 [Proteobacteria bacterium]|nr:MAG: hypothetical protein EOP09_20795 [Pseudomonadota bacterium]